MVNVVSEDNVDPAFSIIKKHYTDFIVWRVEDLKLVAVSKEQYGKFYKGDSYLVYSAAEKGTICGAADSNKLAIGTLEIHIHFWIGSETSQDEAGVAAIKAVEMDTCLGGAPIQHRETEGNESNRFHSYFKQGIRYLKGGVASGFRKVVDDFKPSLYHVKGKRFVIVYELPEVSWDHINEGDVFVLDTRKFIFVWSGRYSNNHEKLKAARFASKLRAEHGDGHIIVMEDGQETALGQEEITYFDDNLPLNSKKVQSLDDAPKDEIVMRRLTSEIKLFRCSEETDGTLKVLEVKNGPFSQKDLDSNDSFILDNGHQGIWVWVGKKATRKEREEALRNAQGFISKKGYPANTQVTRIIDGGEPLEFRTLFTDWKEKEQSVGFGKKFAPKRPKTTVQTRFDASTLHRKTDIAAKTQMMDDGTGQKEIWRIKQFDLVEVSEDMHGQFFMGDCYIILYAYATSTTENYIIYYWIGSEASIDEAGTAALKSIELDDKLNGRAVQVRVAQGREPPHFMAIFSGKMIIYEGGYASAFDGRSAFDKDKKDEYMLQVTGTSPLCTKAIEVDFRAACLNSNDCFIISTPQQTFVWCGKGSTGDEREMAKSLAKSRGDPILISEGHEKTSLWETLGGREEYASTKALKEEAFSNPPRLFHCSNISGILKAEEIVGFNQTDLIEDDVMLLDAWDTIFIWVGNNSNREEQKESVNLAFEYLKTDPAGRQSDTTIIKIKQGFEPPTFTGFFGAWNNNLWNNDETYGDICQRLKDEAPGATILVTPIEAMNGSAPKRTYPLSTLFIMDMSKLPLDVDPTCKEDHLCDADFKKLFEMDRDKYMDMPHWRRVNLKKKVGLF